MDRYAENDGINTRFLNQRDVHLSLWLLVLVHLLVASLAHQPVDDWLMIVLNTNALVLVAFLTIFHLLIENFRQTPAGKLDLWVFGGTGVLFLITGLFGSHYDVGMVMVLIAIAYLSGFFLLPNAKFIGLVYGALAINGFIAPLLFHLFKDVILIGEVLIAAAFNNLIGLEVTANGTRLSSESGMRLEMIGACSVYANLSFALLGFASVKAFFKQRIVRSDVAVLFGLALGLIALNTIRLGLMAENSGAYEFWHHGDGASYFAGVQFLFIMVVCLTPVLVRQRRWHV